MEGIRAEGLALQFLGFALFLVPGGQGSLFQAGAVPLWFNPRRSVWGKPFCSVQAIVS